MTRRPTVHYGQLAAALATFATTTGLLSMAANGVDGQDAAAWTGPFGAILTVWTFATIWVLMAIWLSVAATVRTLRRRRPAPGRGGRSVLSLVDVAELAAAERRLADAWIADGPRELLPVDPAAAVRPRPAADQHATEARHAIRSAA